MVSGRRPGYRQGRFGLPFGPLFFVLGAPWPLLAAFLDLLGLILALLASAWRLVSIFWPSGVDFYRFFVVFRAHLYPSGPCGLAEKTEGFSISRLNASWAALRTLLGASGALFWTVLGLSWAPLGRSWGSLGLSWGALGALLCALGALLGRSLAHLVALERFSAAPGTLGRVPRASRDLFWELLGTIWAGIWDQSAGCACHSHRRVREKTMGFPKENPLEPKVL